MIVLLTGLLLLDALAPKQKIPPVRKDVDVEGSYLPQSTTEQTVAGLCSLALGAVVFTLRRAS